MKEKGDRKPTGMPKELAKGWGGGQRKTAAPRGSMSSGQLPGESRYNAVGILL